MNKIYKIILTLGVLLTVGFSNYTSEINAEEANVPDANFKACLNRQIGQSDDAAITIEQINSIRGSITCDANTLPGPISDITGAEYLTGVYLVDFIHNSIVDVSPLDDLGGLQTLKITYNPGIDYSTFDNFQYPFSVDLSYNEITEIRNMNSYMKNRLSTLNLTGNQITDLTPLAEMTRLNTLILDENPIENFDSLRLLSDLGHLSMASTGVTDISFLEDIPFISYVNFSNNNLTEFKVGHLENLMYIYLDNNNFGDLSGIEFGPRAYQVSLKSNNITDISALTDHTYISQLFLDDNMISDITGIAGMQNLQELSLNDNLVSDVSPLTEFMFILDVKLNNNKISSLEPFRGTDNMMFLSIAGNEISDISPLFDMKNLSDVDARNQVVTLPSHTMYETVYALEDTIIDYEGNVVSLNGTTVESFVPGETKTLEGDWNYEFAFSYGKLLYSGVVKQEVTSLIPQSEITGNNSELVVGSNPLTDEELLALLNVNAVDMDGSDFTGTIEIVSNNIDYTTVGDYEVVVRFTDSLGNEIEKTFTVSIVEDAVVDPEVTPNELPKTGMVSISLILLLIAGGLFKVRKAVK